MTIRDSLPSDAETIRSILRACELPEDVAWGDGCHFFLALEGNRAVGTIGLESYPPTGLLRSAAVLPEHRGSRIGESLVHEVIRKAESLGLSDLILLTTTAEGYFAARGFTKTDRGTVTGDVRNSGQFIGSECARAVVMRLKLGTATGKKQ